MSDPIRMVSVHVEDLLFYKLKDLILEQSEGEWTEEMIVRDAHHFANHLRPLLTAAPVREEGGAVWPEVTDAWADTYCALTGREPDGQQVTFVDGGVATTFRNVAKREIEAMLCAAPKSAVAALATREEAPAEAGSMIVKTPCQNCLRMTTVTPESLALYRDHLRAQPPARPTASDIAKFADANMTPEAKIKSDTAQPPAREDAQPVKCPRCYRGEVFGLSMDDGFWVEFSSASGGAHPAGMRGWLELAEHHPDGRMVVREYVAKDSPIYPAPDALRVAVEALEKARDALHKHYVDWDGDPEDAVALGQAWAETEQALAALQAEQGAK